MVPPRTAGVIVLAECPGYGSWPALVLTTGPLTPPSSSRYADASRGGSARSNGALVDVRCVCPRPPMRVHHAPFRNCAPQAQLSPSVALVTGILHLLRAVRLRANPTLVCDAFLRGRPPSDISLIAVYQAGECQSDQNAVAGWAVQDAGLSASRSVRGVCRVATARSVWTAGVRAGEPRRMGLPYSLAARDAMLVRGVFRCRPDYPPSGSRRSARRRRSRRHRWSHAASPR